MASTAPPGPMTKCIGCGKTDADPKHGIAVDPETIIRHHYDCGVAMDPPCGTTDPDMHLCAVLVQGYDGKSGDGDAMREHIVARTAELQEQAAAASAEEVTA